MAIPKSQTHRQAATVTDWTLTPEQMLFLMQRHNVIEKAYANDDLESLRTLASSEEFTALFGSMGFDEAYDRYETMVESNSSQAY
jgi:hypothetical protein